MTAVLARLPGGSVLARVAEGSDAAECNCRRLVRDSWVHCNGGGFIVASEQVVVDYGSPVREGRTRSSDEKLANWPRSTGGSAPEDDGAAARQSSG